jgi:hypothetical protein
VAEPISIGQGIPSIHTVEEEVTVVLSKEMKEIDKRKFKLTDISNARPYQ